MAGSGRASLARCESGRTEEDLSLWSRSCCCKSWALFSMKRPSFTDDTITCSCAQPGSGNVSPMNTWCTTAGGATTCNFDNFPVNVPGLSLVTMGTPGANGTNATIAVGTVTTSGSTVTVTNSGTNNAAVLNFNFPSSTAAALPLAGKNVMFDGDSITAIFGNKWQQAFIAATGATYYGQDARAGRTWVTLLDGYGAICPLASLSSLGTWSSTTSTNQASQCGFGVSGTVGSNGTYTSPVNGYTLAQTLANVEVLVIALGTNDAGFYSAEGYTCGASTTNDCLKIGSLSDAYTAGTEYAAINFALDAIVTAKPTLRIIIVTPYFFVNGAPTTGSQSMVSDGSGNTIVITPGTAANAALANIQAEVAIEQAEGAARGIPVLNMLANGNINIINLNRQTRDGTHPTDAYMLNFMGPFIGKFVSTH